MSVDMDHVAIMKPSWGLLPKILSGEKSIESRWYSAKHAPWGRISKGDTVYFKDSGKPVTIKATVDRVLAFNQLSPKRVLALLRRYGNADGIDARHLPFFYQRFKDKMYCLLIFLADPQLVQPFAIDKRGFGAMAAWMCVENIASIKRV